MQPSWVTRDETGDETESKWVPLDPTWVWRPPPSPASPPAGGLPLLGLRMPCHALRHEKSYALKILWSSVTVLVVVPILMPLAHFLPFVCPISFTCALSDLRTVSGGCF